MSHLFYTLTSSDKPDIFNNNRDQRYILNHLIHFASKIGNIKNGIKIDAAMLQKGPQKPFVNTPLKNIKFPTYIIDYVNNIHNNIKCNSQESKASLDVQENKWLHPGLFFKHHVKHIGFVFLLDLP